MRSRRRAPNPAHDSQRNLITLSRRRNNAHDLFAYAQPRDVLLFSQTILCVCGAGLERMNGRHAFGNHAMAAQPHHARIAGQRLHKRAWRLPHGNTQRKLRLHFRRFMRAILLHVRGIAIIAQYEIRIDRLDALADGAPLCIATATRPGPQALFAGGGIVDVIHVPMRIDERVAVAQRAQIVIRWRRQQRPPNHPTHLRRVRLHQQFHRGLFPMLMM